MNKARAQRKGRQQRLAKLCRRHMQHLRSWPFGSTWVCALVPVTGSHGAAQQQQQCNMRRTTDHLHQVVPGTFESKRLPEKNFGVAYCGDWFHRACCSCCCCGVVRVCVCSAGMRASGRYVGAGKCGSRVACGGGCRAGAGDLAGAGAVRVRVTARARVVCSCG